MIMTQEQVILKAQDQYVYGTRETQKQEVIPLDAILGSPDSAFSYVLQDWDQGFCVDGSYSQSRRMSYRTGTRVSVWTVPMASPDARWSVSFGLDSRY